MIQINQHSFHLVESDKELYDIWPRIREGVNIIEKQCNGVYYRPEDVYHEIKNKTLSLFVVTSMEGAYSGFFTTSFVNCPDGKCLHIHMMHYIGKQKRFLKDAAGAVDVIVKLSNCAKISYSSVRKGVDKQIENFGYNKIATVHYYERRDDAQR